MTRFLIALISRIVAAAALRRAGGRGGSKAAPAIDAVARDEAPPSYRVLEDTGPPPDRPRFSWCEVYDAECVRCSRPAKFVFETPQLRSRVVLLAMNHVFGHAKYVGDHPATTAGLVDWFRGCPVCFSRGGTAGELLFSGLERIDLVLCACGWAGSLEDCSLQFEPQFPCPPERNTAATAP
jgi:hypothetical protein